MLDGTLVTTMWCIFRLQMEQIYWRVAANMLAKQQKTANNRVAHQI
jgi:hypothetical protein